MKRYLDIPLIAFVLVMIAAAAITSHGTFVFYSYILDTNLAYAATVVTTAGIPLLELAAVLDLKSRLRYITGMVILLGMEVLAQYFQGQSTFVMRIQEQFPNAKDIDVVWIAQQPWGRILPVLYLAILSLVVVYFGYAASIRIRELRTQSPQTIPILKPIVAPESAGESTEPIKTPRRKMFSAPRQNGKGNKRERVELLLQQEPQLSTASIAEQAGVTPQYVRKLRAEVRAV